MCEKRQINVPQAPFNKTPPMCKVVRMHHQQTVEVSNFENQQQQTTNYDGNRWETDCGEIFQNLRNASVRTSKKKSNFFFLRIALIFRTIREN